MQHPDKEDQRICHCKKTKWVSHCAVYELKRQKCRAVIRGVCMGGMYGGMYGRYVWEYPVIQY